MQEVSDNMMGGGGDELANIVMCCHTLKLFSQFCSNFGGENAVRREEESGIGIGEGRP
jgi:hypothetical protein